MSNAVARLAQIEREAKQNRSAAKIQAAFYRYRENELRLRERGDDDSDRAGKG